MQFPKYEVAFIYVIHNHKYYNEFIKVTMQYSSIYYISFIIIYISYYLNI